MIDYFDKVENVDSGYYRKPKHVVYAVKIKNTRHNISAYKIGESWDVIKACNLLCKGNVVTSEVIIYDKINSCHDNSNTSEKKLILHLLNRYYLQNIADTCFRGMTEIVCCDRAHILKAFKHCDKYYLRCYERLESRRDLPRHFTDLDVFGVVS